MLEYLVFVAAFGSLMGALAYIRSMFRGATAPNRVTWFMWSVAPFVATGFSPFLIFAASFFTKKACWKLGAFDYFCGVFSGLAILLWYLTSNPEIAIIFAITSDALAAMPTLLKGWRNPKTESVWPYLIGIFAPMTSFLAATVWSFSEVAFPIYLVGINLLLLLPLIRRIKRLGQDGLRKLVA
jgi:hypothetical protein